MDAHLASELAETAESHGTYAEDNADRLNSRHTCTGLLVLAAVIVIRQYIFKPIQCWVPANWPQPWEEFAENYCWTQNTYRVSMTDAGHPGLQKRGELEINYYQWVPILLLAQAMVVMAPHQLWCMASRHLSGRDPHTVVRFARLVERTYRPKLKKRIETYAAWQLALGIRMATVQEASPDRGCSESLRGSGCALFAVYLTSKLAYAASAIGQILILQRYLGFSSPLFGWHCARDLLLLGPAGQWKQTLVFPRVTFCDVPMSGVGQWTLHSVQCVLAPNMVYEKVFVLLWFWFAFCCLATVCYSVVWLAELLPGGARTKLVQRHLRLSSRRRRQLLDADAARAASALGVDGAFLVHMISDNAGDLCAARVVKRLLGQLKASQDSRLLGPRSTV